MVGRRVLHAEPVVRGRPDVALSMVGVRAAPRADFDASRCPGASAGCEAVAEATVGPMLLASRLAVRFAREPGRPPG
jgi:hypothetical protein